MEKMSRPGDATSDCRQIPDNRWIVLELLILILNLVDFKTIVVEKDSVLGVDTVSEIVSLKDSLEFTQKLQ